MLTKRLSEILTHTQGSATLADVGCDHGYLGYEALKRGYALRVIATDVSDKSLDKARRLFCENGYIDRVEFRCGDGLSVLGEDEADTVVISGMGGREIVKILSNAHSKYEKLVLSPQSDIDTVRRYLVGHGYRLNHDYVMKDTKFYWIIVAEPGDDTYTEAEYIFGRDNLSGNYSDFIEWLDSETERFRAVADATVSDTVRSKFLNDAEQFQNLKKHVLSGGIQNV